MKSILKEAAAAAIAENIVESLEALMGEEEIEEKLDINQKDVMKEVAEEVGLPLCLVDRIISCMFRVLMKKGCNCLKFMEGNGDGE